MRVIPGVTADTHAHVLTGHAGSKFGLAPAAAAELIARIERSPRLRMQGLHVHVGSQILDVEPFVQSVAPVAALGEFPVYDLGGGLGARYSYADEPPAVGEYLDALIGAAREHLPAEAEVILEPGRSMVASAAATLYRVVTVKRGEITFVAVDGGMGDNLEVALFGQRFEAGIADRLDAAGGEEVTVVGPPLRERRRARRRRPARGAARRRPARRPGDGRVLLHDGQQLQRDPPDPRRVRGRRRGPPGRTAGDLGGSARPRHRVRGEKGERWRL